jgi:hypothetical protein
MGSNQDKNIILQEKFGFNKIIFYAYLFPSRDYFAIRHPGQVRLRRTRPE